MNVPPSLISIYYKDISKKKFNFFFPFISISKEHNQVFHWLKSLQFKGNYIFLVTPDVVLITSIIDY